MSAPLIGDYDTMRKETEKLSVIDVGNGDEFQHGQGNPENTLIKVDDMERIGLETAIGDAIDMPPVS